MKPIASRLGGWVVQPISITMDMGYVKVVCSSGSARVPLPDGLTFSQFLDQYAACSDPIYFID